MNTPIYTNHETHKICEERYQYGYTTRTGHQQCPENNPPHIGESNVIDSLHLNLTQQRGVSETKIWECSVPYDRQGS